jgi:hypothetical protein
MVNVVRIMMQLYIKLDVRQSGALFPPLLLIRDIARADGEGDILSCGPWMHGHSHIHFLRMLITVSHMVDILWDMGYSRPRRRNYGRRC